MNGRPIGVLRALLALFALTALAAMAGATAHRAHADTPLPLAITHQPFNAATPLANQDADGAIPESGFKNPPNPICSTATTGDANVNTDCEGNQPAQRDSGCRESDESAEHHRERERLPDRVQAER